MEKNEITEIIIGLRSLIGILIGVAIIYGFIWVMAYPVIGHYCASESTVATSTPSGSSAWLGDRYKTTFTDGTTATTGYVKKGEVVCMRDGARFPW